MKETRRTFFKKGVGAALLLGAAGLTKAAPLTTIPEPPLQAKPDKPSLPFRLGCAGYTFVNFDLETTLKTMQRLDLHYLCIKDFHLPFKSTDAEIKAFHDKCSSYGVTGYGVGPIYMKSKEEIDRGFEYAKRVGVNLIVGIPNYELLPYVDEKVKEYDIYYAIHLHGPDIKIFPDATDVWNRTKDLDPHIGMCLDIGHDFRNGCDIIKDIRNYKSRIFDIHLKDVTDSSKAGRGIEIGRGKIDFVAFVRALKEIKYTGVCGLEYEKDMKDPFMGIAESIGYFRCVCDMA